MREQLIAGALLLLLEALTIRCTGSLVSNLPPTYACTSSSLVGTCESSCHVQAHLHGAFPHRHHYFRNITPHSRTNRRLRHRKQCNLMKIVCTSRSALQSEKERSDDGEYDKEVGAEDTIRVRIWRALADGEELSLSKLSDAVGERRRGELRSHLVHVERQAKTLLNKSDEWRMRRGLPPASEGASSRRTIRLRMRQGAKNEIFVRLS